LSLPDIPIDPPISTTDFEATKALFDLPEGITYLDGNSLGPLPFEAGPQVAAMMQYEWGARLIRGWLDAGWMDMPVRIGDRIGALIGADVDTVVVGETLSIKVYQALASALELQPDRRVVLSDSGNFPSDLYMAAGLLRSLNLGHELRIVAPEEVNDAIDDSVAVVMLTEVDYRTARLHDMKSLTDKAHAFGAVTIWDLAHSAGAIPIDVSRAEVDFAVGCTYKFLNGGPGAPAFIYVSPDLVDHVQPALSGWMGHDRPFDFDLDYRPGAGIERMRVGTPPIIQLTSLDAALDVFDQVDLVELRARSIELSELFIRLVEQRCPTLTLASPRDPAERGSHVSFQFEHGYGAIQALLDNAVIGDFRAPDIMRFGITPLYIGESDIEHAVDVMARVIDERLYGDGRYVNRARVT
jgi:kynureninase